MSLLAAALLAAAAAPPDFRRQWVCGSRGSFDGISFGVMRTLDRRGAQLDMDVDWSTDPKAMFAATLLSSQHVEGTAEPRLRSEALTASWTTRFAEGADTAAPVAVLHRIGTTPLRRDGRPLLIRDETQFSADIPWARIAAMGPATEQAELSIVNAAGVVIHSTAIDLRQMRRALGAVEEALVHTRWQARDFRKRCEAVTEWLTL